MNALIRQIAVLSALWAMCELLLPDGKHQPVVRMTASLLIMAALLSTVGGWLGSDPPAQTSFVWRVQQASEDTYRRTALAAMANQMESYCTHLLERAGYQGSAAVYLTVDGAVEYIDLRLRPSAALVEPAELAQRLAEQLQLEPDRIRILSEGV